MNIIFIKFYINTLPHNSYLPTLRKKAFENIMGKGENAANQHFLLFYNVFCLSKNYY